MLVWLCGVWSAFAQMGCSPRPNAALCFAEAIDQMPGVLFSARFTNPCASHKQSYVSGMILALRLRTGGYPLQLRTDCSQTVEIMFGCFGTSTTTRHSTQDNRDLCSSIQNLFGHDCRASHFFVHSFVSRTSFFFVFLMLTLRTITANSSFVVVVQAGLTH